MDLFDAQIMAKDLISQHVPEYQFGWMNEKTVNGRCYYFKRVIVLSRPLTKLRTEEAVRTTIMHEIAHAMNPNAGHGRAWKMQMLRFGLDPARCSSDQVDKSTISNWVAKCGNCSMLHYMIRKPHVAKACKPCYEKGLGRASLLTFHRK